MTTLILRIRLPSPVHLAYDKALGRYVADAGLMGAPLPPPEKLTAQLEAAHAAQAKLITEGQWFVPPELTRPVLELIYTGHLDAARDFVEKAWAGADDRRAAYWSDLTECQLRLSPYWPVVAAMNGLAAETPVMPYPRPWPDGSVLHGWQMVKCGCAAGGDPSRGPRRAEISPPIRRMNCGAGTAHPLTPVEAAQRTARCSRPRCSRRCGRFKILPNTPDKSVR